ncbi:unnamed protein product [Brassica oleracea]|uniref:Uncharacterized protein n=1 Tax=Brassica oleracea TaxID=3712 RepID=A0A3P6EG12_BRAOL|nr:unnamed protein product [Brassica oleracea]
MPIKVSMQQTLHSNYLPLRIIKSTSSILRKNHHYMEFKCIHDIPHMRNINYPIDIMGAVFNTETHFDNPARPKIVFYIRDNIYFDDDDDIWLETEGGLSDFRFNPCFLEVEVFRQSLLNNDFYVRRHGAMRPL